MAQLVEQLTLNQWVPGSSPGGCTSHAEVAELADALDSKSSLAQTKWGFDSPLRHTDSLEDSTALRILRLSLYE